MKKFVLFFFFLICWAGLASTAQAQYASPCELFGKVYEVKNPKFAQFLVYEEEYESSADVVVYEEDNWLYCTKPGLWHFVDNIEQSNFTVAFVEDRSLAHFTVYFTDTESFAGCNRR
ncbi:DUF6150 family protein [Persicobacter psychrovividus]